MNALQIATIMKDMVETDINGETYQQFVDRLLTSGQYAALSGLDDSGRQKIFKDLLEEPSRECIECDGGCGTNNPAKRCAFCKQAYYCGVECQRRHWRAHKEVCLEIKGKIDDAQATKKQPLQPSSSEKPPEEEAINTECPICLEDPVVDPVILEGCRHAFCFACLDRHQSSNRFDAPSNFQQLLHRAVRRAEGRPANACPLCRTESEDIRLTILEKVHLYGSRSCAPNMSPEESQEWRNRALTEADKLLAIGEEEKDMMTKSYVKTVLPVRSCKLQLLTITIEESRPEPPQDAIKALGDAANSMSRFLVKAWNLKKQDPGRDLFPANSSIPYYLDVANAFLALGAVQEACQTYNNIVNFVVEGEFPNCYAVQFGIGASKAFYMNGNYDWSIRFGKMVSRSRCNKGVHKYLVKSLKNKGENEEARKFLQRAIFYEAPWDEENHRELLLWYNLLFEGKLRRLVLG